MRSHLQINSDSHKLAQGDVPDAPLEVCGPLAMTQSVWQHSGPDSIPPLQTGARPSLWLACWSSWAHYQDAVRQGHPDMAGAMASALNEVRGAGLVGSEHFVKPFDDAEPVPVHAWQFSAAKTTDKCFRFAVKPKRSSSERAVVRSQSRPMSSYRNSSLKFLQLRPYICSVSSSFVASPPTFVFQCLPVWPSTWRPWPSLGSELEVWCSREPGFRPAARVRRER